MRNREYGFTPIKDVIDYWHRYWIHRVREIDRAYNYGSRIQTPRFLLDGIVFEIEQAHKINTVLFKSFQAQLGLWNKFPIFKSLLGKDCSLALSNWDKPVWVATLCKSILNKMDEGVYYNAVINELINTLSNQEALNDTNRQKIHRYTDIIIGELISKNYCLEDIEKMIHYPGVFMAETFEVISADDCVCGFKQSDYPSNDDYLCALTNYFLNQTLEDKVHILDLYYNKQSTDAFVLIRLSGIYGKIDITFDGIKLYSIEKWEPKHYISPSSNNWIESNETEHIYINAAIPVEYKMPYSAIKDAVARLKKILAPIQIWLGVDNPISYVDKNITIIVNGLETFTSKPILRSNESDCLKSVNIAPSYYDSHDINREITKVQNLSDRIQQLRNLSKEDCEKLYEASKWIQNAQNSSIDSDKLLYSWFAIESLIKLSCSHEQAICPNKQNGILDLLKQILTPIIVRNRFYHYRDLILDELYRNFKLYNNRYKVPDNINEILFGPNGTDYDTLFHSVNEIQQAVINEAFIDLLCDLKSFYNKNSSGLNQFNDSINYELTYIYCLRNHIVHNGNAIEREMKYFSQRAIHYASSLYNAILSVTTSNNLGIQDAIIKICADCESFKNESQTLLTRYNIS